VYCAEELSGSTKWYCIADIVMKYEKIKKRIKIIMP
jgi:hypothetical protein